MRITRFAVTAVVVMLAVCAVPPALANPSLINLGYNVQAYPEIEFSRRGLGSVVTLVTGEPGGFYVQLASFTVMSSKSSGTVSSWLEGNRFGSGLNFVLGYGLDINFGKMGIIVGGGFFGTIYTYYNLDSDYFYYEDAGGPGGGVNFYFQPGSGPLVVNAGLNVAWRPFTISGNSEWGFNGFEFESRDYNLNINAGIGFRD